MKHIAAYALLVLGGKAEPTAADVEKVLKEAGAKGDADKIAALVEALKGKAFHELVAEGTKAMGSVGSAAPAGGAAAAGGAKEAAVEEKEEEVEEADVDMGDLFGGDY
jgi:large subunit ribosomal protein LP2